MKYFKVKDYYGDIDFEKINLLKFDDFKLNMCFKKVFSFYEEVVVIVKYVVILVLFVFLK